MTRVQLGRYLCVSRCVCMYVHVQERGRERKKGRKSDYLVLNTSVGECGPWPKTLKSTVLEQLCERSYHFSHSYSWESVVCVYSAVNLRADGVNCLSYFSVAVLRYSDQDGL